MRVPKGYTCADGYKLGTFIQRAKRDKRMDELKELCAEIGSAMMVNMLGIETDKSFRNSASYIKSWLEVLKNDNRFIVSASSKAEKAVNYILGVE